MTGPRGLPFPPRARFFHRPWSIWLILAVATGLGASFSGERLLTANTYWEEDFGWSSSFFAMVLGLGALVTMVMASVSGIMGDRLGARGIMFRSGALLLAGLLLLSSVFYALVFFIAFAGILSIARAFILVPLYASVSEWFIRRFSIAVGLLGVTEGIVSVFVPVVMFWLSETAGWRLAVLIIAVAVGGLIMLCSIPFRSRPSDVGAKPYGDSSDAPGHPAVQRRAVFRIRPNSNPLRLPGWEWYAGYPDRDYARLACVSQLRLCAGIGAGRRIQHPGRAGCSYPGIHQAAAHSALERDAARGDGRAVAG